MSIRLKLLSVFLALSLIPLFFVSTVTFQNYEDSLRSARISQLKNIANFKAERIEGYYAGLKVDMEIVQNLYNIKKNFPVLTRLFREPANSEFVMAKQTLDAQLGILQPLLRVLDIMLIDGAGHVVYSSNAKHSLKEFGRLLPDYEWGSYVQGKKGIYLSDVFPNKAENGRLEMVVAAPAVDLEGAAAGTILFEIDLSPLYAMVNDKTGLGKSGETLIGKKEGDDIVFLSDLRYTPENDLYKHLAIGAKVGLPIQAAVLGKNGEGELVDYRGQHTVAAWRYLPSLGWGMVAKIDSEEAFADVLNLKRLVAFILGLVVLMGGVMAFALARSIAEPIKKLSEGAKLIGAGNLDLKVANTSRDEIGQLSRAFDKMTADLKEVTASRDDLNREIAERKQAEAALRESERHLSTVFRASPAGIFVTRQSDGQFMEANDAYLQMIGYTATEVIGHNSLELNIWVNPEDRSKIVEEVRRYGPIENREVALRRRNGKEVAALYSVLPFEREGEQCFLGTLTDITERKQMEEALRQSEARFKVIASSTPDHILVQDRDLRYTFVINPQLGLTEKDMLGRTDHDFLGKDDAEKLTGIKRQVLETGNAVHLELPLMSPTGDAHHFRGAYVPKYDAAGQIDGLIGYFTNVTEQKRAEEATKTALNRLYTILSNMSLGVLLVTEDGQVEFANQAFCNFYDLKEAPAELEKLSSREMIEKIRFAYASPEKAVARILEIAERGQRVQNEEVFMQGQRVFLRDFIPIRLGENRYGRLWVHQDITDRKLAEAALQEREEQLKLFVEHAPAAIAMFDTRMCYIAASQRWLADYGLTGDIRGFSHYEVFPEISERWKEIHRRCLAGAVEAAEDDPFLRADGSTQWLRWEVRPWRTASGTVGGIIIFSEDITERKKVGEAVQRERNNLQTIFDVVNVGMLLIDEKGTVLRVNRTISAWGGDDFVLKQGRQPGDIVGCIHALSDPAGCGAAPYCANCLVRKAFESAIHSGEPVHNVETEVTILLGKRQVRLWVEISVDPLVLDGGRHAIIAMNNIDARKRAEAAFTAQRDELQTIMDSVSAGIFYKDKENHFLRVNAAFCQIMGLPKEELERRSLFDLYPREQAEAFWKDDQEVIVSCQPKFNIIEPMQVGGEVRWFRTDKVPYRNPQGDIIGVIGFAVDITERKRMEDDLRKLNRTLRAMSNSNQAIMRAGDEYEYMLEVCQIIVNDCGHSMAWIGLAENDAEKSVRPLAQAGFEEGYLDTLHITWADSEHGRGPTGTAVRTGHPSLCRNMQTDPAFKPWREEALKRGYAASAAFPLVSEDKVFGAITIYSKFPDPFSVDEIDLLKELANDLAYGITLIRLRDEHAKVEEAIHLSLLRFELLAQTASELLQTSEPLKLVDSLCRKVMDTLDCQAFFNFLVDEQAGRLHLNACAGIPEEEARRIEWLDFGVAVCGCVARDGFRIVAENIPTTTDPRTELVKSYGIKAYACHPLLGKGGKVIGTLSFGTRNRETFSEEDLSLMKAVASQVSMAMIRMQDEQELQLSQLDAARLQVVKIERQRLYSVLETLPVYVVLLTPDYHLSFANRFFRERFGEYQGQRCYEYLFKRTTPCEICETYKVLSTNAPHHWEWVGPDGRNYDIYDFPFKETDGSTHIMEMGIDVTDRKKAQQALLEAQRDIDRAKRLSDIGMLAATVAHELRNPLAAIGMASENIRRKAQNPILEKHISNIFMKVAESDQIINNLLFYSRLKPPHYESVNLQPIIDECIEMAEKNSKRPIRVTKMLDQLADHLMEADPIQIREVFINILNNACDALPPEGGGFFLKYAVQDGFITLFVQDNGHGMTKEQVERAFDPFFTTKAKGTGLGLAVCRQVVSFHGGTISLESEPGKGTTVIVRLPLKKAA